jgi:hypothetical protein
MAEQATKVPNPWRRNFDYGTNERQKRLKKLIRKHKHRKKMAIFQAAIKLAEQDSNNLTDPMAGQISVMPYAPAEPAPIGMLDGLIPNEDFESKPAQSQYYGIMETHFSDDGATTEDTAMHRGHTITLFKEDGEWVAEITRPAPNPQETIFVCRIDITNEPSLLGLTREQMLQHVKKEIDKAIPHYGHIPHYEHNIADDGSMSDETNTLVDIKGKLSKLRSWLKYELLPSVDPMYQPILQTNINLIFEWAKKCHEVVMGKPGASIGGLENALIDIRKPIEHIISHDKNLLWSDMVLKRFTTAINEILDGLHNPVL